MTNSTIKLVQDNIRKYRLMRKYTQEQLSEKSGISNDYLSEIERGKKAPSLKRLLMLAEALEIEPQNFFL